MAVPYAWIALPTPARPPMDTIPGAPSARWASMRRPCRVTRRLRTGLACSTIAFAWRYLWKEHSHGPWSAPPSQGLVEGQPVIPCEETLRSSSRWSNPPKTHGLLLVPSSSIASARNCRNAWKLNSNIMRHPRRWINASASSCGSRLRHQRMRLLHRAWLLHAERPADAGSRLGMSKPSCKHVTSEFERKRTERACFDYVRRLRRIRRRCRMNSRAAEEQPPPPQIVELCVRGRLESSTTPSTACIFRSRQLLRDTGYVSL